MAEDSMENVEAAVRRMAEFAAGPTCDLDAPTDLAEVARAALESVRKFAERRQVRLAPLAGGLGADGRYRSDIVIIKTVAGRNR